MQILSSIKKYEFKTDQNDYPVGFFLPNLLLTQIRH
jgi:hypothetical protein